MGGTKVKGLSIRSNSDMNVSQSIYPATIKKDAHNNKEQDFLKPRITQVDYNGCPISPGTDSKVIKFIIFLIFVENIYYNLK